MSDLLLNVAAVRLRTRTNGPGWRAAVWVQGCSIRCPGCFNPHTHPHERRRLWPPEELAARLVNADVEGVSILGGEPFEQAGACARLARETKRLGGSVVTYSGYAWSYLCLSSIPEVKELIDATDLLIAGPFVASNANDGRGWHGSANQEIVHLTERYVGPTVMQDDEPPVVELWTDGGTVAWSGIPAEADIARQGLGLVSPALLRRHRDDRR